MYRLLLIICGATLGALLLSTAFAQETAAPLSVPAIEAQAAMAAPAAPAPDAYGYNADDVAVGQGVVLYWYAHGYANAYGNFPATFADMVAKGLPLRKFMSPHTGAEIMPDDGTLDFDGDMTYKTAECGDVTVMVQTTKGVITLPGTITASSDISVQFGPCCPVRCGTCIDITICEIECWNLCDASDAACKIVQWIMWKSFETHQALYGMRPADEAAWMASGLAPIDKNYKEYVPTMDIEYIYSKGDCCFLKKAKVNCCSPCAVVSPCKSVCKPEAPCGKCNKCESKSKCNTCETKSKCNSCDKCAQKTCSKCKPENPCGKCKSKCNTCQTKPKCDTCKPKCNSCDKCAQKTCSKCKPENPCGKCKSKCNSCETKPGCSKCSN